MYLRDCTGKFEYFLSWYGDHWMLGTLIVISVLMFLYGLVKLPFEMYRVSVRASVLRQCGWPPENLALDGEQFKL